MRLLFDALSITARPSGTRTRLFGLLGELVEDARLEIAVAHSPELDGAARARVPGVRWLEVERPPRGAWERLRRQRSHLRALRGRFPFDLVISECAPFPADDPFIATIHDLRHLDDRGWRGRLYRRWLLQAVDKAVIVHVVSESVTAALCALAPSAADRFFIVPNGVDTDMFTPGAAAGDADVLAARGITSPYILVVGHLETRKRPEVALAVRTLLAERGINLPVLFAGRGPVLPEDGLCALEARFPEQNPGWCLRDVAEDELPALYRGASFVMAPAALEGFGMAPLEAAACGRPVIASDIPAHREVMAGAALLCPPDDVAAFERAALDVVYNEIDVAALREKAIARAEVFSWRAAAGAFLASLEEVGWI